MDTTDTTPSIAGVFLQNVQVGGNLTISGVTVQLPAKLPPLWVNVPSLPNHFLGRDALVDDLVARLIAGHSPALSAEGLPGVGKTTLAVVLAHHPDILAHFSDGVLWAGLGPTPDVPSQLAAWATALGIDVSDLPTPAARAQAVGNAIGQRRLLLVIDDAWHCEAADLLRCGGPRCSHLLTTRDQAIARALPASFSPSASRLWPTIRPSTSCRPWRRRRARSRPGGCSRTLAHGGRIAAGAGAVGRLSGAPRAQLLRRTERGGLRRTGRPRRRLALATRRLGARDGAEVTLRETTIAP
ncbi:MAG: hypothetical protein H6647_20090 [Anaerolineales bacterium]|nr:hypothetical protein [Anaerolineales bacterium]